MNEKELVEKRNENIERMNAILNTAKAEKRIVNEEENAEFEKLNKEVENIENMLKMEKTLDKTKLTEVKDGNDMSIEDKEYKMFENYIRSNFKNSGEMTKGNNGDVIPQTIADRIIKKIYEVSPIVGRATKFHSKGKLIIPVHSGKYTVAFAAEFTALTSQNKDFDKVEIDGFLAGALTKISESLINNADVDIVAFVINLMAESIANFMEDKLLNGQSSYCKGIGLGLNASQKVTTASATAITSDDVVKLLSKVKSPYKKNAMFVCKPEVLEALRLLKGSDNHYLLNDDITSPFGHTLLGYPIYESDNAKGISASNAVLTFGDFSCLGLNIHEDINVKALTELYAPEHAIGVIGWTEFDGDIIDQQGLAQLVMHA